MAKGAPDHFKNITTAGSSILAVGHRDRIPILKNFDATIVGGTDNTIFDTISAKGEIIFGHLSVFLAPSPPDSQVHLILDGVEMNPYTLDLMIPVEMFGPVGGNAVWIQDQPTSGESMTTIFLPGLQFDTSIKVTFEEGDGANFRVLAALCYFIRP